MGLLADGLYDMGSNFPLSSLYAFLYAASQLYIDTSPSLNIYKGKKDRSNSPLFDANYIHCMHIPLSAP